MAAYEAAFPAGTSVSIAERARLEQFQRIWKFHHPLTAEQLAFAGKNAKVHRIGYYHGGDVLYELAGIPGLWHEPCLRSAEAGPVP